MSVHGVVTLSDVAAHAGVSLATASRVINGSDRIVGPRFHERVMAAANELGYRPNPHAQAMARGHSTMIGLMVHDISDPYFSTIAAGAMAPLEQHGLLVLGSTLHRQDYELGYVATMRAQRARALILVGSRSTDADHTERLAAELASFRASGGRVAVVGQDRLGTDTVLPENRAGALDLAEALIGQGHRNFAVLGGPADLVVAQDRVAGFAEGLARHGARIGKLATGAFTRDGGYEAMLSLIAESESLETVFAVNDVMAIGAMAALRERGLNVPGEVAVAGFDDIPTLRDVAPSLTTVRLPLAEMGRLAAEMVTGAERDEPESVRVHGQVVLRDSTARTAGTARR